MRFRTIRWRGARAQGLTNTFELPPALDYGNTCTATAQRFNHFCQYLHGMATDDSCERRTFTEDPSIVSTERKQFVGKTGENLVSCSDRFARAGLKEEDFDYHTRNEKTTDIAQSFYTLVTDFYEYGYGESFHFAPVKDGLSFSECIADYEREIAKTLNARPGMKILVSAAIVPHS